MWLWLMKLSIKKLVVLLMFFSGKQKNSTLGSVEPLAMFFDMFFIWLSFFLQTLLFTAFLVSTSSEKCSPVWRLKAFLDLKVALQIIWKSNANSYEWVWYGAWKYICTWKSFCRSCMEWQFLPDDWLQYDVLCEKHAPLFHTLCIDKRIHAHCHLFCLDFSPS